MILVVLSGLRHCSSTCSLSHASSCGSGHHDHGHSQNIYGPGGPLCVEMSQVYVFLHAYLIFVSIYIYIYICLCMCVCISLSLSLSVCVCAPCRLFTKLFGSLHIRSTRVQVIFKKNVPDTSSGPSFDL